MAEQETTVNVAEVMEEIRADIREKKASGEIDIEDIMDEIRAEAAAMPPEQLPDFARTEIPRAAAGSNSADLGAIYRQLDNEAQYLKSTANIPYHWYLGGGVKGFLRRAVRKVVGCIGLPLRDKQNDFNQHTANGIDAACIAARQNAERAEELTNDLNTLRNEAASLRDEAGALRDETAELRQELEDSRRALAEARAYSDELTAGLRQELADSRRELQEARAEARAHSDTLATDMRRESEIRMTAQEKALDGISMNIARVVRECMEDMAPAEAKARMQAAQQEKTESPEKPEDDDYKALDYFHFQNDFRGTQNRIMENQRIYIPYFKGKTGPVFDLGCGRGEFLRLMKEEKIPAYGMDMYPEYTVTGKLYGVDIREGDGIAELERVQEPLGGVFSAQVIEHLGFRTVEKLCRLAYDKLEKGAWLVLETPNPMCLSTMTNAFYLDPTHERPVHPLLMEYLLKEIGFEEVTLIWPDHSLPQIPEIRGNGIENLAEVNEAIRRVSGLLYGSQDYAVAGRK